MVAGETIVGTWGSHSPSESVTIQTVPESSTGALLGIGALGSLLIRSSRQRTA